MVQPIQYQIPGVTDPFANVVQGLRLGSSLAEMDAMRSQRALQEQALQQQLQQRQMEMQRQQQLSTAYTSLLDKVRSDTWKPEDFQQVAFLAPKEMAETTLKSWERLSKDRQAQTLSDTTKAMAALGSKNPELGVQFLTQRAAAYRNQGNEDQAKWLETQAKLAEVDPVQVRAMLGSELYGLPGGKDAIEALAKAEENRRAAELQPGRMREQDAKAAIEEVNAKYAGVLKQNEIVKALNEAKKLGLEAQDLTLAIAKKQQDLSLGPTIEADARKIINDAVTTSAKSSSIANQYETLADSISADMSSGALANVDERIKRFFGSQDQITALRQEYRRLRNSQVLQNLPPGAASDIDIEIAMKAFPDEAADPEVIVRFLRGTAKLQRYDAALNDAQAQWVAQNGSLARARKPIEVMGQVAPKGADFNATIGKLLPQVNVLDVQGIGPKPTRVTQSYASPPQAPAAPPAAGETPRTREQLNRDYEAQVLRPSGQRNIRVEY
jgi:hypothetical protein